MKLLLNLHPTFLKNILSFRSHPHILTGVKIDLLSRPKSNNVNMLLWKKNWHNNHNRNAHLPMCEHSTMAKLKYFLSNTNNEKNQHSFSLIWRSKFCNYFEIGVQLDNSRLESKRLCSMNSIEYACKKASSYKDLNTVADEIIIMFVTAVKCKWLLIVSKSWMLPIWHR